MNYEPETPTVIVDWITNLIKGRSASIICDPWLRDPKLLTSLQKATGAKEAVGLAASDQVADAVRKALPNARIDVGEPVALLREATSEFDVIAGNLPFGMRVTRATVETSEGVKVKLTGELDHLLLVQAALRLKTDGAAVSFGVDTAKLASGWEGGLEGQIRAAAALF